MASQKIKIIKDENGYLKANRTLSEQITLSKDISLLFPDRSVSPVSQASKVLLKSPSLLLVLSEHYSYKKLLNGKQVTSPIFFCKSEYQEVKSYLPVIFDKVIVSEGTFRYQAFIHTFARGITDYGCTVLEWMLERDMLPDEILVLYWANSYCMEALPDSTYLLESFNQKTSYRPSDFYSKIINSDYPISIDVSRLPLVQILKTNMIDYLVKENPSTYLQIINEKFCPIPLKSLCWIPA